MEGLGDALGAAGGIAQDIGTTVVNAIIGLINSRVIDSINNALEFDFDTHVPGIGKVGVNPPDIGHIPELHTGGRVLRSGLAEVERGEHWFAAGAAPATVNVYVGTLGLGVTRKDVRQLYDYFEDEARERRRRWGG